MDKKVTGTVSFELWVRLRKLSDLTGKNQNETVASLIERAIDQAEREIPTTPKQESES